VRFVFDTNIIVSALLFESSKPAQAFRYALKLGEMLLSLDVLEELNEVLGREKFDRYITREEREEFLETLVERSRWIEKITNVQVCRDPDDNKILALATSGGAQFIITGDQDLLILNPFQDIQILTAEEFLQNVSET
jgi:uncharacterized protein